MNDREGIVADIARHEMGVKTLEHRYRDALDFHSLSVVNLREGLTHAYDAGWAAAWLAGVTPRDLPTADAGPLPEPTTVVYHHHDGNGVPFNAVLFTDGGPEGGRKLAIVFDEPGLIAVLDVAKLAAGDIAHASNGWRGDRYERMLRAIIAQHHRRL